MLKQLFFLIFVSLNLISCNQDQQLTADSIIDQAVFKSGTFHFANAKVKFDFRDITYTSLGECGEFKLKREFTKDSAIIEDVFDQKKFQRKVNQQKVSVSDSLANLYAESINSVLYFVQLPYRLKDPAVQKKLIGKENINGNEYHKIKVSFQEEGGGQDFEDIYMYWIHTETFDVDYLAYSFLVNGGGIRFREAYNPRKVNNIKFVDYRNYDVKNKNIKLEDLAKLFQNKELKLISSIENSNIEVEIIDNQCL
ncbi:MAG: deoxyribose-phosphate aldolase [Flavobacteriaceae bacterium]|nr:deoxyribose-phosphate aldolase [Flavobacteriaceae bacterium]